MIQRRNYLPNALRINSCSLFHTCIFQFNKTEKTAFHQRWNIKKLLRLYISTNITENQLNFKQSLRFIQYKNRNSVPVDITFGKGPREDQPLEIVGDLIAAVKKLLPSKLGSVDPDELTLHSVNNGVETRYNSWDPLTLLGDNGKTGPK